MSETDLNERLQDRLRVAQLEFANTVVSGCAAYLALLQRWNARINLTALPLTDPLSEATIDKLIVEPLSAASLFPRTVDNWIDLGSGGGSPAIPLRLANPGGTLTMVEARERKCAFLREAIRVLGLERTVVEALRFEQLRPEGLANLITIRAVRLDETTLSFITNLLGRGGMLLSFGSRAIDVRLVTELTRQLPDGSALFGYTRA